MMAVVSKLKRKALQAKTIVLESGVQFPRSIGAYVNVHGSASTNPQVET
jgi:hypothetical protein